MTTKLKAIKPTLTNPGHIKCFIFGKSGVGKTWLALNFPKPMYIDTEGGARLRHYQQKLIESGGGYYGMQHGSNDLDNIIEQISALATEKHDYKTLIIDSITKPWITSIGNEQERLGDGDGWGASKKPAVAKMRRIISWISKLDMNVFLIAHELPKWETVGKERKEVGVIPDTYEKVLYELDLALQIRAHSATRRDAVVHKTRLLGFPQNEVIVLQDGVDFGYQAIADRYGRDFIEAPSVPIILATPEQVDRIKEMFKMMNLTEEQIAKGLAKKNAETIEDLSAEDAQTIINDIQKKLAA